ncbi:DUF554 domain-containing protein [Carboxylicivirga mesophila]|uniref:DUF554 domain-containing protein n=1 Tax=Carboxylicivirga mesophila TaxID=1166478 RepID=A0ABS5KE41_9BACT|nr:DUF554 domain-containing protein [Carboxylicivirga mesophila]MBS2213265.1 DUF554 domain-containing protein [Carboxylicivirga mesophila]
MLFGGTLVNVLTVLAGSAIGILIGNRIPEKMTKTVFQAIGLFTIVLGVGMAVKGQMLLIIVFSLIIGTILGELMSLDKQVDELSGVLKTKLRLKNPKFAEGMLTAFLLYCVGSMTIVGAIDEGMGNGSEVLMTKALMDGFSSIALASVFGVGVSMSVVPLLIFQGGITLLAYWLGDFIGKDVITELTAVGGILLVGLGINILEIKQIRIMNMLPSLIVVVVLIWLNAYL